MNGYQPKREIKSPPPINPTPTPKKSWEESDISLEELAKQCKERGNRLEVMNGKAYEVTRKFIKNVE